MTRYKDLWIELAYNLDVSGFYCVISNEDGEDVGETMAHTKKEEAIKEAKDLIDRDLV